MQMDKVTWQVVAIVAVCVSGAVAVIQVGDQQAAVLLPMMIGVLTPILQLIGVQQKLNGGLDDRIKTAVRDVLKEENAERERQKQ